MSTKEYFCEPLLPLRATAPTTTTATAAIAAAAITALVCCIHRVWPCPPVWLCLQFVKVVLHLKYRKYAHQHSILKDQMSISGELQTAILTQCIRGSANRVDMGAQSLVEMPKNNRCSRSAI
jgi:hypothetical protein